MAGVHRPKTRAVVGDYNAICDVSGERRKASEMEKDWQGRIVVPDEHDPRHPQDFVRTKPEHNSVPEARPEPTADTFTTVSFTDTSSDDPISTGSFTADTGTISKG